MQTYLKVLQREELSFAEKLFKSGNLSPHELQQALPLFYRDAVKAIEEDEFVKKNASRFARLSAREIEILTLVARGDTSRDIGRRLFISKHTVDTHRRHIIEKLGLQTICCWQKYVRAFGLA